jgi:DNA-binding MarR family transcriptional regulator
MAVSSSSKSAKAQIRKAPKPYRMGNSVSATALLRRGSDRAFQKLVFDLFSVAARLERVRVHFASRVGISGPQYTLLRAVASLQGEEGVSIGTVAEHLHVTSAFVTAQSGLLVQRNFISKKDDSTDRRISRLSLTANGERLVDEIITEVRPLNDLFFGRLGKDEFDALTGLMEKLLDSSRDAMVHLNSQAQAQLLSSRDHRL